MVRKKLSMRASNIPKEVLHPCIIWKKGFCAVVFKHPLKPANGIGQQGGEGGEGGVMRYNTGKADFRQANIEVTKKKNKKQKTCKKRNQNEKI